MLDTEMEEFCKSHDPEEAAQLLRQYVIDDQPDSFMPDYSTRAMCRLVADCYKGRYGGNFDYMDFYMGMWSGDSLGTPDERKARHIRCGIPLDE